MNYSTSYNTYFKHHCSICAIYWPLILKLKVNITTSTMVSVAPQRMAALVQALFMLFARSYCRLWTVISTCLLSALPQERNPGIFNHSFTSAISSLAGFNVEMSITLDTAFSEELSNVTSPQFKKLKADIEAAVSASLTPQPTIFRTHEFSCQQLYQFFLLISWPQSLPQLTELYKGITGFIRAVVLSFRYVDSGFNKMWETFVYAS